jgi:glutamyl-Q tRNA(Asp) synthetase
MVGSPQPAYRGRFAPSPTGPLHFGSLVAAVGSWADARARGGEWLVRMEDLDPPREVPGAADEILRTLEALGLEADGPVIRQSDRGDVYRAALDRLRDRGVLFACACTRREIADSGLPGSDGGLVYPGTCRNGPPPGRAARALRVRVDDAVIAFDDALQGEVRQDLGREVGDFVLLRADGLIAYQLAVVIDDAAQGITDVVRGADLLDSTPRQILLQRLLGLPTPGYLHLPVATNAAGEKLSKQTGAPALDHSHPAPALVAGLRFLGQPAPAPLERATARTVLEWAAANWDRARIPRRRAIVPTP